ncbi:MAG: hypothetical protein JSS75_09035 [Bacteroidetes bacterium]|nr:hypothetical protein [Bacteroidota bacterium]
MTIRTRIAIACLLVIGALNVSYAQAPRTLSYQGYVLDGSQQPVTGSHAVTVKLYDQPNGGSALHSETFTTTITGGVLSVTLGSTTAIDAALGFDKPYWIGVSIDGAAELAPRTALTAVPYALHAATVDAGGAVTSINNQHGAITIQGGGGTTVSNVGGVFTISSSGGGGGNGIQGVQSTDGSLAVTNANGPTATINIAAGGVKNTALADGSVTTAKIGDGEVTTAKIADNAVTSAKIGANQVTGIQILGNCISDVHIADGALSLSKLKSGGASSGQVLKWNGTAWAPGTDNTGGGGGGLTLPFTGSGTNGNSPIFSVTNSGNSGTVIAAIGGGGAGIGTQTAASVWADAGPGYYGVVGTSKGGNGYAGVFGRGAGQTPGVYAKADSGNGLYAIGNVGHAGYFEISNNANTSDAVYATTNGSGSVITAVRSSTSGTTGAIVGQSASTSSGAVAIKGELTNTSQGDGSVSVYGKNDGTSSLGIGVEGSQAGGGWGVYGTTVSGRGVYGESTSGTGVYAWSSSGTGLYATSSTGVAGQFSISNSSSTSNAISSATAGSGGYAGSFANTNSSTSQGALYASSSSTTTNSIAIYATANAGTGVYGISTSGSGGYFQITSNSNSSDALVGKSAGSGNGVFGTQATYSASSAGVKGSSTASNGTGVIGEANSGSSAYGVWGKSVDGHGVQATVSGTGTGLWVNHSGTSGNLAVFQASGSNVARIDRTGKGFFNGGTQNSGADVAEAFAVDGDRASYEPGDVLVISTNADRRVAKSNKPYSTLVSGVYATKPGVLLTERDVTQDISDLVPMGVVGVIPTKVCTENGPIKRGDLLVTSSKSGVAMKGTNKSKMLGAIIGKALGDFSGKGVGTINVMVNVK